MQKYQPFFENKFRFFSCLENDRDQILSSLKSYFKTEQIVGGNFSYKFLSEGTEIDRLIFLINGEKVGIDFKGGIFDKISFLENGFYASKSIYASNLYSLKEAGNISSIFGGSKKKTEPTNPEQNSPQEKHIPKTQDFTKDILKGSEVFKDAERKIRIFLRGAQGGGNKNLFILGGLPGLGKAQFFDTPLLTPKGWIKMGDIKVGDYVIGSNGKPTKVTGVFPQGQREVYKVEFNFNNSVECCDEHLWTVYDKQAGSVSKVFPLKEMLKNFLLPTNNGRGDKGQRSRFWLPKISSPIEFDNVISEEKNIDPYLLGVLLGDGSVINSVGFTSFDTPIVERISSILKRDYSDDIYLRESKDDRKFYSITRGNNQKIEHTLLNKLRNMDVIGKITYEKSIPKEYLYAPAKVRLEVLRGLMDTDGTIYLRGKRGRNGIHIAFGTSSFQLHKDFIELIYSFGGHCTVSEKYPSYIHNGEKRVSDHIHYTIEFNFPKNICPFFLHRKKELYEKYIGVKHDPIHKITNIYATGEYKEALCIRVEAEDSLYVTENYVLTHNSVSAKEALVKECGAEITPDKAFENLKDISFDAPDFDTRLKAREAIEQAKNLYKRYLHNFELSKGDNESRLFPEDIKQKAVDAVQKQLENKLYGYKLTIRDVEGTGNIEKSSSDVIQKLKKLGGEAEGVPYNPKNGWMEIPAQLNNKDLFMELYGGNAKTLFVDEGDYFIVNDIPLMKIAFNNGKYRKISSGKKGYMEVHGRIIPDEFVYSGKMVITTNVPSKEWNSAIKSRANTYFFYLTLTQLFDRLRDIIPAIQQKDLPHLPQIILTGMRNTLMNFAKKGELQTFDFRTFVALCDEFALMLQDQVKEAQQEIPSINFSVYGKNGVPPSDEMVKQFKESDIGRRIWSKASAKFKKVLLNQIQQMNKSKADEDDPNVIPIADEDEVA